MTLDEIVLHDFGAYAGENKICLTPADERRPVVLFGGMNGAGKTTILDALQLCLFGAQAQCAGRGDRSYHGYLEQMINRRATYQQSSISVVFHRFAEGQKMRYRATRVWKKAGNRIKESVDISINKMPAPAVARSWDEHINQIMPSNIAHLFFFDGEKASLYASPESAQNLVQTAVHSLLGMDVVEHARRDLAILERRRRNETLPQVDRESISAKEDEQQRLEKKRVQLTEQRASIQTQVIESCRRELEQFEKAYRDAGGNLRDKSEKIKRRLQRTKSGKDLVKARMLALAEGRLPLLMVSDLLIWLEKRGRLEQEAATSKLIADALERRDRELLKKLPKTKAGKEVAAVIKAFCADDIEERRSQARMDILLKMDTSTMGTVELVNGSAEDTAHNLNKIMQDYQKWSERLDEADEEFSSIPEDDVFAKNIRDRGVLEAKILQGEEEVSKLMQEREGVVAQLAKLDSEIEEIQKNNLLAESAHKDVERFLACSENARKILAAFKHKTIRNHIAHIENLVLESYQTLLRKQSLIGGLKIDADTFEIALYDRKNRLLPMMQLSKGEQQLLVIALLWGMARASGKALPMAIDTPLGRLDSTHRTHLVDRYFGRASHQVLLFSTDEEITGNYLKKLRPYIGRNYLLSYNDADECTSISEGVIK